MTTLYKTVPITSAEQAEALPEGSILRTPRGRWSSGLTGSVVRSPHHDETIFRVGVDQWPVRRVLDVFAEALVPIGVEEEGLVAVSWTDCDCEWGTSYCDEYHRRAALLPRAVLSAIVRPIRREEV